MPRQATKEEHVFAGNVHYVLLAYFPEYYTGIMSAKPKGIAHCYVYFTLLSLVEGKV